MVLSPVNKLKVFQLLLSDPGRSFYSSGDKLSGSVRLEAALPCRLSGLRVTAAGCACVGHCGGKKRRNRIQEVDYLKYEEELRLDQELSAGTELTAPAAASKQKKVTCTFVPDGQVSISARIHRKGFCQGEEISINAKFENTCSRSVAPKAAIIAEHSYLANKQIKEWRQKLSAVRGNHILSGRGDPGQGRSLRVPRLTPTLLGCDIITVEYALMIYLHIPGSEKLILELPLVIGTILLSDVGSRTPPPSYGNIHRDLEVDGPRTPLLQDYDEEDDDGGLFMTSAELCYRPPPAYTEVDQDTVNPHQVVQVF